MHYLFFQRLGFIPVVNGDGVKQDFKKDFYWFHQAALQGHIDAQLLLSEVYAKKTDNEEEFKEPF